MLFIFLNNRPVTYPQTKLFHICRQNSDVENYKTILIISLEPAIWGWGGQDNSLKLRATGWITEILFPASVKIFLFGTTSRSDTGSTHPPVQLVPGLFSRR